MSFSEAGKGSNPKLKQKKKFDEGHDLIDWSKKDDDYDEDLDSIKADITHEHYSE